MYLPLHKTYIKNNAAISAQEFKLNDKRTSADWNTQLSMTFTSVGFNTLSVFYNNISVTENGNAGGLTGILNHTADQNTPSMAIHRIKNDKNAVIYTKPAAKGKKTATIIS